MLTTFNKYAIASALAVDTLQNVLRKLVSADAKAFAEAIDCHYRKRDGFVPRAVIRQINQG